MTLLWIPLLLLSAYGVGAPLVRRLVFASSSPLAERIIAVWLGAATMGLLAMLGNAAALLPQPVALVLLAAAAVNGAIQLWVDRNRFQMLDFRWEDALGLGVLMALYGWYAAWNWLPWLHIDSFAYHFTTPKQWLLEGRLRAVPYEVHANFHLLWSGWLFWGIVIESDNFLLPRQQVALALLSIAVLLTLEIRRVTGHRLAAWTAGLGWMLTAEAMETCLTDYMDMIQAGMVLIGALMLCWAQRSDEEVTRLRGFAAAGLAMGFVVGLKSTGLAFAFLMGIALIATQCRRPWAEQLRGAVIYGGIVLALWVPWAVKNIVLTGNPFYPFLLGVFGAGDEYRIVAEDFHGFYEVPTTGEGEVVGHLKLIPLYLANVTNLDPNKIVGAFLIAALWCLLKKGPRNRSEAILLAVAVLYLPLAMFLPARRFQLSPLVVLYLFAAISLVPVLCAPFMSRRWFLRGTAAALIASVALLRVAYAQREWAPEFVPQHEQVAYRFYLDQDSITSTSMALYQEREAVKWLEENLPDERRVLVTSHIPLSSMADVRVLSNVHNHGKSVLAILTEDQSFDVERLVEKMGEWEIGAIFTEEDFGRNDALAQFRRDWLTAVGSHGPFTMYTVKDAPR